MGESKLVESTEAQNPGTKTLKETSGSFGLISNDTTLVAEAQKNENANCSDNVEQTVEMANSVSGVVKRVDSRETEKSSAVNDPCKVENDIPVKAVELLSANSEVGEMKVEAEAVSVEKMGGVGQNVEMICGSGDLGDKVVGDEKNCGVNDGVDVKTTVVGVDNAEIASLMVEAQNVTSDVDGGSALVGVSSMFGSEGNIGTVDGTEQHFMLNDLVDRENKNQPVDLPLTPPVANESEESGVKKGVVEEVTEKELLGLTSSGIDPDICKDGISLFVELSGSSHSLGKISSKEIANLNKAKEEREEINDQECDFSVGDVVWFQTKNRIWWPGRICDHADGSKYDVKTDQRGSLLIHYFGSGNVTWSNPSQLKSFYDNFKDFSQQNKSRTFKVAVEKAVHEFGRRVKLYMSCSCSLQRGKSADHAQNNGRFPVLERKSSGLAKFSANGFESVRFLKCLKGLAQSSSLPGILETVVKQNILSAFLCFMGHSQLPVYQLQDHPGPAEEGFKKEDLTLCPEQAGSSGNFDHKLGSCKKDVAGLGDISKETVSKDGNRKRKKYSVVGNALTALVDTPNEQGTGSLQSPKSNGEAFGPENKNLGGGGETRERKKSKYLSYPYVNWEHNGKHEDTDQKLSKDGADSCTNDVVGSPPSTKSCSSTRFQKRWARKFMDNSIISKNPELVNMPSKLLSKLRISAVNSLYSKETDGFDFVEWFFSRFRISVYHDDYEMYVKNTVGQNESISDDSTKDLSEKSKRKMQRKKAMSKHSEATGLCNPDTNADTSTKTCLPDSIQIGHVSTGNNKSLSGLSDVDINLDTSGLVLSNTTERSPLAAPGKPERKRKRKKVDVTSIHLQARKVTSLPDLNGNNAVPGSAGADMNGNNIEPGSLWVDLKLSSPTTPRNDQQENEGNRLAAGFSNSIGKSERSSSTIRFSPVRNLPTGKDKPIRRRRKRKDKALSDGPGNNCLAPVIPDLNGTSPDPVSPGKSSKVMDTVSQQVNPEKRKRRKRGTASKGLQNKSLQGKMDIGTALLMTFSPGPAMPSKEELLTTFCKFGPLKESETHSLKDSGTAQVVFTRSSDSIEAFQSLGKSNPFGASLVNYRLHQQSTSPMASVLNKNSNMSQAHVPVEGFPTPVKPSGPNPVCNEAPPLDIIKQNLKMMTSVLEKSGDNLPPEMRNKLEGEIKSLLMKVSNMAGPSSA